MPRLTIRFLQAFLRFISALSRYFAEHFAARTERLLRWVAMGRLISKFLQHVLPGVVRPLHVLWNEIIGFLFLVLAGLAVPSLIRTVRAFEKDAEGLFRIVLTVLFALVMVYFGVASFLRARKISRS
jgi:hypothetical protein